MHRPRIRPPLPRNVAVARRPLSAFAPSDASDFQKAQKVHLKQHHKRRSNESVFSPDSAYQITCGLEVHAQLNTTRKLFSDSRLSFTAPPNTHISPIDCSLPGTQPTLNPSVLLPALRAALAFNCTIPRTSRFDRKHYFYWDQPAGYQITQFYSPLAVHGTLSIPSSPPLTIPIRQVQLEQDTGKTLTVPGGGALVDLNRVGAALVEIITDPFPVQEWDLAGRVLAQIQSTLRAVGACTLGMEWGGLRADVNVSVARRDTGVLGQRCEIKNLASFKTVNDAVAAEAARQIRMLERTEIVKGETRGWDADSGTTRRMRGKEGEVDYRYMPEPDLPAVVLSDFVLQMARRTMPRLPEELVRELVEEYGITMKDARTMLALDDGVTDLEQGVVRYFKDVVSGAEKMLGDSAPPAVRRTVGNWVLMDLGGQLTAHHLTWEKNPVHAHRLAELIALLLGEKITGQTAKSILSRLLISQHSPREIVDSENLAIKPVDDSEILRVVESVLQTKKGVDVVNTLKKGGLAPKKLLGLRSFVVGSVMREFQGQVKATRVEGIVGKVLEDRCS